MWDQERRLNHAAARRLRRIRPCAAVLALGLIGSGAAAAAGPLHDDKNAAAALTARGRPLTAETRKEILRRVLAHPGVTRQAPGHRLAGIRVTVENAKDGAGETRTVATVVLFDHTAGEARRVIMDTISGELLANVRLRGRPQGSPEEFEEAARIVRRDPELARLLDQGGVLDGGFIVDDPAGSRRRMMQLKLLSADRLSLLRSITVDLTRRRIASSQAADGTATAFSPAGVGAAKGVGR